MKITQAESRKIIVGLILIGIALGCETDGTDDQPEPSIDATILDAQPEVVPSFESLASVQTTKKVPRVMSRCDD